MILLKIIYSSVLVTAAKTGVLSCGEKALGYASATALELSRLSPYLVDLNKNELDYSQLHKCTS